MHGKAAHTCISFFGICEKNIQACIQASLQVTLQCGMHQSWWPGFCGLKLV